MIWNSNGLCGKWIEAVPFISKYDICSIVETKFDHLVTDESIDIQGYYNSRYDRNSHGGGVITYIKKFYKPYKLDELESKYNNLGIEVTVTSILLSKSPAIILAVYRPPSSKAEWFDHFRELISEVLTKGRLIIMGDLNCDFLRPTSWQTVKLTAILRMANSGLFGNTLEATRITPSSSSCLDIISIDKNLQLISYSIVDYLISDHHPVQAVISSNDLKLLNPVSKRCFNNVDFNQLGQSIAAIHVKINDNIPVEQVVNNWYEDVLLKVNAVAPVREFPMVKRKSNLCLDSYTKQLMRYRESESRSLRRDPSNQDTHDSIRTLRKIIKSRTRANMKKLGAAALDENRTKDAWKFIRKATFSVAKGSHPVPPLNLLNDHFASTITSNVKALGGDLPSLLPVDKDTDPLFNLHPTDRMTVQRMLKNVREEASTGPDDLSPYLIKRLSSALAPNVTRLINISLESGHVPTVWKEANVTAVYKKKGSKTDVNNYRPISVLPALGLVLEKIVARQLQGYCDAYSIIPNEQFGFRKNSSCELALLAAQDKWMGDVAKGSYVGTLMVDLSKAFDSVDHTQLIDELQKIGCDRDSLRWFSSYLDGRVQRVKSGNTTTPWKPVNKGVPQGSALSPLLFNILMRQLPSASGSDCFQFADDLTNSATCSDLNGLRDKLEKVYCNIKSFCTRFNMEINLKKTQLIVFKPVRKILPDEFHIVLDGISIYPEKKVQVLGVTLDRHLTMADHIDLTVSKCHGLLGMLRRASTTLPRQLLKLAYTSLIRSQLEYCSAVFTTAAPSHLTKLDVIQKMASRIVMNADSRAHSEPLLTALSLESLESRRKQHVSKIVEKILGGRIHPYFKDFLNNADCESTCAKIIDKKRFSYLGKLTLQKKLELEATTTRGLQSTSTGRTTTSAPSVHSAIALLSHPALNLTSDLAPSITLATCPQLDALAVVALVEDGDKR